LIKYIKLQFVFALLMLCVEVGAADYHLRELSPLPGHSRTMVKSLNNSGRMVGYSVDSDHYTHPVEWAPDGTVIPLDNETYAINNLNQTVGRGDGGSIVIRDSYGSIMATYENGYASSINDLSAVVGTEYTTTRTGLCYWTPDHVKYEIDPLDGYDSFFHYDLNNQGQVVGICQTEEGQKHGFYWSVETGIVDISSVTGNTSFLPEAINDNGAMVGGLWDGYAIDNATMWTPESGIQYLDQSFALGWTRAMDINNNGQIVGYDSTGGIVWDALGNGSRLDSLYEGQWSPAFLINDNGVIAGHSHYSDASTSAIVWEPVPEPSSIAAFVMGLVGLVIRKRVR
jgi:probable HAF family extracellular repeat protein